MQSWKVVTETVTERKQQLPTTTQEDLIMKKHDAINQPNVLNGDEFSILTNHNGTDVIRYAAKIVSE
jgi:hypothetical protein